MGGLWWTEPATSAKMLIPDGSASDQYPGDWWLVSLTWTSPLPSSSTWLAGQERWLEEVMVVMVSGVEAVYLVEACQRVSTMGSLRLAAGG